MNELDTDIYKIMARVKNEARKSGAHLTPAGDAVCNTFCHVFKALYDFADTIKDEEIKSQLYNMIQTQERVPANLINAFTNRTRD